MPEVAIDLPEQELETLARRWRIEELALFGSVTREDFDGKSDIDVLVTF
ncbi:MAG TPA: nucleotidyltransferase domain-containing protein, partial [Thermoanaerobaculia bacterium]|nr:nucleotidyltransferase domain-containing protein [Thermoanaerobaculia bacterium]